MSIVSIFEIVLISIGLAMDAFGVSIGKGLTMPVGENGRKVTLAFLFGLFQFLMPLIGWLIGRQFIDVISDWDHWIIFGLLGYLGIAMIREGLSSDDEPAPSLISLKHLLTLGVATSIDALAVGVSFAFLSVDIVLAVFIIDLITFVISFIGVKSGHFLGKKFKSKAEIFGGLVLLVMAVKILHEHGVF